MTDYDSLGDKYAAIADDLPANKYYERPATLALLPPLDGLDVLDAGCGAGFYTDHAAAAGARVVAFDPSAEMIRYARDRIGDRAEFLHCRTEELPELLGDRRFDLILSCMVMHYVADLDREFGMLAERLKPGGRMIVSMKHPFVHAGYLKRIGYRTTGLARIAWKIGTLTQIQRPLGDITSAIATAGLLIERLVEPYPLPELNDIKSHLYEATAKGVPLFIQFVLRKPPIG